MSYFRKYSRDEALVAAAAIAEAVGTVTGANRARKLLLPTIPDDPDGNEITSSTLSVLRAVHMTHPASMILFRSALECHERFGCGLGTMVVLVREILTSVAALLRGGVDPNVVVSLLPECLRLCRTEIEDRARTLPVEGGLLQTTVMRGLARGANSTVGYAAMIAMQHLVDSSACISPDKIQERIVQVVYLSTTQWDQCVYKDTYALPVHVARLSSGLMDSIRREDGGCLFRCVLVMGSVGVLHNFDVGHACDTVSRVIDNEVSEEAALGEALKNRYDKDQRDGEALGVRLAEAMAACGSDVVLLGGDASQHVRKVCSAKGVSLIENIPSGQLQDIAVFLGVQPMRMLHTLETKPAVATVRLEWLGRECEKEGHILVHRAGSRECLNERYKWQRKRSGQDVRCVVALSGPIACLKTDVEESFWVVLRRMCSAYVGGIVEGGGMTERKCAEALEKAEMSSYKNIQDTDPEIQSTRDICAGSVYGAIADAMRRVGETFSGRYETSDSVSWDDKDSKLAGLEGACLVCVRLIATDVWMVNGALGAHAATLASQDNDKTFARRFGDDLERAVLASSTHKPP